MNATEVIFKKKCEVIIKDFLTFYKLIWSCMDIEEEFAIRVTTNLFLVFHEHPQKAISLSFSTN